MALIKCSECGKEISDKAKACPSCGNTKIKKEEKHIFAWIVSILTFCVGITNLPKGIFAVIAGLFVCPIITNLIENKTNFKFNKSVLVTIYVCICICSNIINMQTLPNEIDNEINSNTIATINSVWAQDFTPLTDFKYSTNEKEIYISEYQGDSKKVKIADTYEIDGEIYTVVSFSDGVFTLKDVESVILPNTLKSMPSNTFNSCGIKYIYIPKTLEKDTSGYRFYDYFHQMQIICYGGTQLEWNDLTDTDKIDSSEIKFNINSSDLK